jgi:lipoprotein-anchoring transpeptidase ErfK/SrfK
MTGARRLSTLAAIGVATAGGAAWFAAAPAQAATTTSMPCSPAARACVDLTTQQAWLAHDGVVDFGPVPVRSGESGAPTDPGTFHVTWKDLHHKSKAFHNAPMPFSVFFNGGDALHEGSLSVPSHGCVHLSYSSARTFYDTLRVGDEVQVVP